MLKGNFCCKESALVFVCRWADLAYATIILRVKLFPAAVILTLSCYERKRVPRTCEEGISFRTKTFCLGAPWSFEKHLFFAKRACDSGGCDRRREMFVFASASVSLCLALRLRALQSPCTPSTACVSYVAFSRCVLARLPFFSRAGLCTCVKMAGGICVQAWCVSALSFSFPTIPNSISLVTCLLFLRLPIALSLRLACGFLVIFCWLSFFIVFFRC